MVCAERIDKIHPMAESFSEAKSALEEVLRLYKWGRHTKGFPEEVYLLLSRCTYLCFSLWQSDQESQGGFFHRSPPPGIFRSGFDFEKLRGREPGADVLPADSRDTPLTNDTKWFESWMRILEHSDPRGASLYQEFSGQVLACVGHSQWLDIQTSFRNRKALHLFLQTDQAGRVLLRTIAVLEDTIQAILRYFTTLDGRTRVLEKIALLTGVLSEMRQIIVWETPARGPYAPARDTHWRIRHPWTWLSCDRSQGVLTVIPKREGGEVICTYSPASEGKGRFSWARQAASLKGTYEETLFATWSYDTGEHRGNPQRFPGVTACWTLQYAEAQRLEALSRQVDLLLAALQGNPRCNRLVWAVRGVLRNGAPRWKATMLPWTYVRQLDELLNKLTAVYRQANALGGGEATENVVAEIWPAGETTIPRADPSHRRQDPRAKVTRETAPQDEAAAPEAQEPATSEADLPTMEALRQSTESSAPFAAAPSTPESSPAAPSVQAEVGTPAAEPSEKPESSERDSTADDPTLVPQEDPAPTVCGESDNPEQPPVMEETPDMEPTEADPGPAVVPVSQENPVPTACGEIDCLEQPPAAETTPVAESVEGDPEPAVVPALQENPVPTACGEIDCLEQPPAAEATPSSEPTEADPGPAAVPAVPESPVSTACGETDRPEQSPAVEMAPDPEPTEADPGPTAVPAVPKEPEPKPTRAKKMTNTSDPDEMADALVQRLLEHHGGLGRTVNCEPLSAAELQRDLGWNSSKVQRALTKIFGPKPVRVYRSKCENRTIATFLKARHSRSPVRRRVNALT